MTHHLLGVAEVAELLGVSRQRVHQLALLPHFPRPEAELSAGKIWSHSAIHAWQVERGRLTRSKQCSFCGKAADEVMKLIAGPREIAICNECVDVAAEVVLIECEGEGLVRVPAYYFKRGRK